MILLWFLYHVGVWDVHKQKLYMVMTRTLVNFSPWLRICSWLELRGKQMVSYVSQVREEQMVRICLYVHEDHVHSTLAKQE